MSNPTSNEPLADVVSNQYGKWVYPEPIRDLPAWLENHWQWFDPSHAHPILWPAADHRPDLDILIAGCGTNQAAVFAYNNPQAQVTAIDVSQASLDHHQFLKRKYGLTNLDLQRLPVEEIRTLGRDFDLIVATGVIHHLADPQRGLQALAQCLRQQGVIGLMLYARYGRLGVEMVQSLARDLGLQQDEASLQVIKDLLGVLPQNHPLKSYLAIAPDLQYDAGLVDTFLHGRDRSYTIDDCRDLVRSAGLVFQDLFLKGPYYPAPTLSKALYDTIARRSAPEQWSLMERIQFNNGCHFFMACRPDRPEARYRIDFSRAAADHYTVSLRYRCTFNDPTLSRHNRSWRMTENELAFVRLIDGRRTLGEIVVRGAHAPVFADQAPDHVQATGKALLQRLWQLDMVNMT